MRLATVLLFVSTSAAAAQAPYVTNTHHRIIVSSEDPIIDTNIRTDSRSYVDDTTNWHSYFPLEVGNRWQYRRDDEYGSRYFGYEAVRDSTIEGQTYVAVQYCDSSLCYNETPDELNDLRYDEQFRYVARWEEPYEAWWNVVPCPLDASFGAYAECSGFDVVSGFDVSGGLGYDVVVGQDTIRGVSYKLYESIPYVTEVVSGLGVVSRQFPVNSPDAYEYLVYARVGGVEVGTPAFVFPTSSEENPEPLNPELSVWPNPARGRATVSFGRLSMVRVEVTDLTGRRVLDASAPGRREIALDLSALSPGVYAITAISGGQRIGTRLLTIVR